MADNGFNRREFLRYSALAGAGAALGGCASTMSAATAGSGMMGGLMGEGMPAVASLPAPDARQGSYAEVNGARIFYQVSGQGQPLVLLHGYPLSGALFARNRDALAAHFRVITIDHRGYGKSTAPGVPDSADIYASDALAVMTQIGIQQAIIGGHSMGGPITFGMYRTAPERFRGMMLIDTIAAAASPIEMGLWNGFATQARQQGVASLVGPLIKDMLSGDTRTKRMDEVTYLGNVIKECSVDAAVGGAKALANRSDATALLGQIKVPTLVYVGVEDSIYPVKIAMMMKNAIPNSTLVTIPGAAHAAVFEAPERTNQAFIDWASKI